MEELIQYVNKLQKVSADVDYKELKWELPEIAIIGNQSDGKTSILENIVGEDFLPKGRGMVTRRPLVLQLHQIKPGTKDPAGHGAFKWAVFEGKVITSFQHVKQCIEAANNIVPKNDISEHQIFLDIFSPDVVTLTLVDMPGLFKVQSDDQAPDLPRRIDVLVRERVSRRNTIMLVVTSAASDLNTSVALELAKDVNPDGDRTLVILTKMDLVDAANHENIKNTLLGKDINVKLGIIGVINRSESEIVAQKKIQEKRKEEEEWFSKNLKDLAHRSGTTYLSKRLSNVLGQHIKKCIPELTHWISDAAAKHNEVVAKFAPDKNGFIVDKEAVVFEAVHKFCKLLSGIVEGPGNRADSNKTLCNSVLLRIGGARIYDIFHDIYSAELLRVAEPFLNRDRLKVLAKNAGGVRPRLFITHETLESIASAYIKEVLSPSLMVAEETKTELDTIINNACVEMADTWMAYPNLKDRIVEEARSFLQLHLRETRNKIKEWVESESNYLNLNNLDFDQFYNEAEKTIQSELSIDVEQAEDIGESLLSIGSAALESAWPVKSKKQKKLNQNRSNVQGQNAIQDQNTMGQVYEAVAQLGKNISPNPNVALQEKTSKMSNSVSGESEAVSSALETNLHIVENAVHAYIKIVRKVALDQVPKLVMANLVQKATKDLILHLHKTLYNAGNFEHLVAESPALRTEREKAHRMLHACEAAKKAFDDIQVRNWED